MKPVVFSDPSALRPHAGSQPKPRSEGHAASDSWRREMEKAQLAMWLGHGPVAKHDAAASDQARRTAVQAAAATYSSTQLAAGCTASETDERVSFDAPGLPGSASGLQPAGVWPDRRGVPTLVAPALWAIPQAAVETGARLRPMPADSKPLRAIAALVAKHAGVSVDSIIGSASPPMSAWTEPRSGASSIAPGGDQDVAGEPAAEARTTGAAVPQPRPDAVRLHCQAVADGLLVWIGADRKEAFDAQALVAPLRQLLARHALKLLRLTCNGRVLIEDSAHAPERASATVSTKEK